MLNVGIVGATGYAGEELIDILLRHPGARITDISAKIAAPQKIARIFPKFAGRLDLVCKEPRIKEITAKCDLVFLALPHTVSMDMAPALLAAGKSVIDLSADYRLKDVKVYEKFYQHKQKDKVNLAKAVYGLPELYRAKIKNARLIANPGCYPTASILALAPLAAVGAADLGSIIINASSGVTGAGRKAAQDFFFSELNENFKAYKINNHQHAPEINQELSKLSGKKLAVTFVPHLLPVNRGILTTIYVRKSHHVTKSQGHPLISLYKNF
ncbi:MAG: N-acetyl-gamma-glutamyl-phosphate reductase, partial [Candidatus Omnitrophica bacterium]|nr:N-acetyl-gamma-glutamyl-phosphate reductase [Candidatus Omnitrophota bacterium]